MSKPIHSIRKMRREIRRLREENARLNDRLNTDSQSFEIECLKAKVELLTRERDEARAEVARWKGVPEAMREHGFPEIGDTPIAVTATVAMLVVERDEARERVDRLESKSKHDSELADQMEDERNKALAEVARLEGLILDWADNRGDHNESQVALLVESRRIRGEKPRLSTEQEAKAAMGDGQPLVRMREIQ